jgi:oxygen-independent coproporphyrinogen III oxidase
MKPGIYVHLPFCAVHCVYCDFPLTTQLSLGEQYYAALQKEIEMHRPQETADTLYFGGGTPSLTPAEVLERIRSKFDLEPNSEVTLEANPNEVNAEHVTEWLRIGINRLSIGVQSLESAALKAMLRTHSPEDALNAIKCAKANGMQNVNVDLIIGSPNQTVNGFLEGLKTLIDLPPQHFSLYFLEIHEQTALSRQIQAKNVEVMPEEDQVRCYVEAIQLLQQAGYQHYEVSNFALPGYESRHNLKYWTNAPYEAYGIGACSYVNFERAKNVSSIQQYIQLLNRNESPAESKLLDDRDTVMRNALIFGMRKTEGVNRVLFQSEFGHDPASLFPTELLDEGLMEIADSHLRLTFRGMLLSNEILSNII